jgi:hypothetical protein
MVGDSSLPGFRIEKGFPVIRAEPAGVVAALADATSGSSQIIYGNL